VPFHPSKQHPYKFSALLPNFLFFVKDFSGKKALSHWHTALLNTVNSCLFSPTDPTDLLDPSDPSDPSDRSEKTIGQITNSRAISSVKATTPYKIFVPFRVFSLLKMGCGRQSKLHYVEIT